MVHETFRLDARLVMDAMYVVSRLPSHDSSPQSESKPSRTLLRQQLSNSYRRDLAWRPLCDSNTVVVMKQLLLSKKRVVEPIIIINTAGRLSREHHRCGRASLSILSRPPRSTQSIAFSFVYLSSILLAFVVMTVIRLILLFVQLHLHFRLEHFIVSNIVVFVTSTMQHE